MHALLPLPSLFLFWDILQRGVKHLHLKIFDISTGRCENRTQVLSKLNKSLSVYTLGLTCQKSVACKQVSQNHSANSWEAALFFCLKCFVLQRQNGKHLKITWFKEHIRRYFIMALRFYSTVTLSVLIIFSCQRWWVLRFTLKELSTHMFLMF